MSDRHGPGATAQLTPRFRVLTPAARRVLAVIAREKPIDRPAFSIKASSKCARVD
jgi:hypothetical protein